MTKRLLASLALLALLVPAAATAANIQVRSVDLSTYPTVRITVVSPKGSKGPPTLREDGEPPAGLEIVNLGRAKSLVVAIDRSRSMRGKPLAEAVNAARAFVAAKPPADRIAVTTFATKAVLLTPEFSSSTIDADSALRGITGVDNVQGTKLYDDLVLATQALAREPLGGRVIIVVTDGNETRSAATLKEVITKARKAHVGIYVIAIESSRFTPKPLKELAGKTGGRYYGTPTAGALRGIYTAIASELTRTWRLEFVTTGRPGDTVRFDVSAPSAGAAMKKIELPKGAGGGSGGSGLLPAAAFEGWGAFVLALAVGLLVLLGCGLAFATRAGDRLRSRLRAHVVGPVRRSTQGKKGARDRWQSLATLFRVTEQALGKNRQWMKAQRLLERADVPLKTVELLYISFASAIVVAFLVSLVAASPIVTFFFLILGGLAPLGYMSFKARRRMNAFENQLPDVLTSLAASLKAGHSFKSALQAIVEDNLDPTSKELQRVLAESQLGRPMDDALAEMADRVGSKNFAFIITAVNIQSQVGGSLAGIFDMVADTVRQRHQFQRKIKSLTAMGRMSAYVLIGLPFVVAGAISLLNPDYMQPLYDTSGGHKLIVFALLMMVVGSMILKKIVSFKG